MMTRTCFVKKLLFLALVEKHFKIKKSLGTGLPHDWLVYQFDNGLEQYKSEVT